MGAVKTQRKYREGYLGVVIRQKRDKLLRKSIRKHSVLSKRKIQRKLSQEIERLKSTCHGFEIERRIVYLQMLKNKYFRRKKI